MLEYNLVGAVESALTEFRRVNDGQPQPLAVEESNDAIDRLYEMPVRSLAEAKALLGLVIEADQESLDPVLFGALQNVFAAIAQESAKRADDHGLMDRSRLSD